MRGKLSGVLVLCALLLLAGCAKKPAQPEAVLLKDASFSGAAPPPGRVENVDGTALFDVADEIEVRLGQLGAAAPGGIASFYVLLDKTNPTQGILVRAAEGLQPGALGDQSSRKVVVTGDVRALDCPELLAYFQETYGLALSRNAAGQVLWVDNEGGFELIAPAPSPEATPAGPEHFIDFKALEEGPVEVQVEGEVAEPAAEVEAPAWVPSAEETREATP